MEIVPDAWVATLEELLQSAAHPRERFELARASFLAPPAPGDHSRAQEFPPYQVMAAALRDGYDLRVAQQVYGLFSPSRKIRASAWAIEQLRAARAFERAAELLARAAELLGRAHCPATLRLAIIPADPSNRNLMQRNAGLSMFGGGDGLAAEVWPSAGNMARLGPALARGLALAVRWAASGAERTYTLGDALAAEGLAAALVARLFPELPAPWLVAHAAPPSWPADLQAVAELYGAASYARVPANNYGQSEWRELAPPPEAAPLDAEELDYAEQVLAGAISANDPRTLAAHLYGDAIIAEQGHPQAGLPPYAGFELAYRLVLRANIPIGAAIGMPSSMVLGLENNA